ncbi:VOC family protein [Micrococcales bacterium 31B]|nr:VOC family protein [Micrococcales bacterium 31B]
MAIARDPVVVLDCADPLSLAEFYARVLGGAIVDDGDWCTLRLDDGGRLCFQVAENYRPPQWPGQDVPQQMHLDVVVNDLDEAEAEVLAAGAVKHEVQPGTTFRVFLDPAGHPLCLCLS